MEEVFAELSPTSKVLSDKIGKGLNRQVIVMYTEERMYKTMESLYELTEQYAAVRDMLFDEDVDEQVINDTLESIERCY